MQAWNLRRFSSDAGEFASKSLETGRRKSWIWSDPVGGWQGTGEKGKLMDSSFSSLLLSSLELSDTEVYEP